MRKVLSVVLAMALCIGTSTAQAAHTIEIKLDPDSIKALADILKPPPKSFLGRATERMKPAAMIFGWSTAALSTFANFCYLWEPCNDTAARIATSFHFKHPNDSHRPHDHE